MCIYPGVAPRASASRASATAYSSCFQKSIGCRHSNGRLDRTPLGLILSDCFSELSRAGAGCPQGTEYFHTAVEVWLVLIHY